jgi:hypothetical protein
MARGVIRRTGKYFSRCGRDGWKAVKTVYFAIVRMAWEELLWMIMIEALLYVFAVNEARLREEVAFAERYAMAAAPLTDGDGAVECSIASASSIPISWPEASGFSFIEELFQAGPRLAVARGSFGRGEQF